jgi:hypothetical protein
MPSIYVKCPKCKGVGTVQPSGNTCDMCKGSGMVEVKGSQKLSLTSSTIRLPGPWNFVGGAARDRGQSLLVRTTGLALSSHFNETLGQPESRKGR